MTSNDNQDDVKPPEPVELEVDVTPGQLLARKREALGLSIQQVADELHITMHYVRALEADAHDKLPGEVFIRGYIRAYANFLKLDPTVLVNVFNEFINQRENGAQEASYSRNRRRRDRNLPWIVVSGVAFVAIAVALWYFGAGAVEQGGSNASPAAGSRPAETATTAAGGNAPSLAEVATSRATGLAAQPAPTVTVSTSAVSAAASVQSPAPAATSAPSFSEPAVSLPGVATAEVAATPPATTASTPAPFATATPVPTASPSSSAAVPQTPTAALSAPVAPAQLISVDAGGADVVEIVFSGESLVQIDDGSARQIYRDIRVAGDRLQVNGTGPFNVLLGDASTAELHLNGKKIDFTDSIRIDNSARLTIGL